MNTLELVVWSVMLGGLLTIGGMALVDVLMNRSVAAWRSLLFMVVTGSSCVLLSGLPEALLPGLPQLPLLVVKSSLGPLSGALVLSYLGQWLGVAAEDRLVHRTIVWGSLFLVLSAFTIASLSTLLETGSGILLLAACVNALAVLLVALAAARAAQLGDTLARTMVLGCLFMAGSTVGLNARQLGPQNDNSLLLSMATACSTVAFFLVMVSLVIRRNRQIRHLKRLTGLSHGTDPATGLPRGSVLLSKVDDAFWRSARLDTRCSVICLHLRNLYALGEEAGHGVDQQILAAVAARIRRAVGFRCVVGLYHPRCFVVVLSAVKQAKTEDDMGARLRALVGKPLEVVGQDALLHVFTPQFGVGMVTVVAADAVPGLVIDEAERLALASEPEAAVGPVEPVWEPTAS